MEKNTEFAVVERRKLVAEKYFGGLTPRQLTEWYTKTFNLSKKSLDLDVTHIRKEYVPEDFNDIWKDELVNYYRLREKAELDDDMSTILAVSRLIQNHLKLINPSKSNTVSSVTLNQNNINVPDLTVDELKRLLKLDTQSSQSNTDNDNVIDVTP